MSIEINEAEEYLGLLWEKQAAVQRKLRKADEQIGTVCNALSSNGIAEFSSDDNEDIISDSEPSRTEGKSLQMRLYHLYPLT